ALALESGSPVTDVRLVNGRTARRAARRGGLSRDGRDRGRSVVVRLAASGVAPHQATDARQQGAL
ncbi:MAG TPA: hypothetical protein VHR37_00995, partial [Solirubrobacterales bacterium]|nr:hypothetical protein [Solirubrobacterales bacterium]